VLGTDAPIVDVSRAVDDWRLADLHAGLHREGSDRRRSEAAR
jgi:hypothetical protein